MYYDLVGVILSEAKNLIIRGNTMVTLKDIAKHCNVSIATVSYVLNNTKSVSPETRDRVMNAVQELGYIPNTVAKNLKNMSVHEIGVVFTDIDDLCHSEILKGIMANAENHDYSLDISFSYNKPRLEERIIKNFIGKNVDGIIIMTCQPQNSDFFKESMFSRNIPTVFIERFPENFYGNFLSFDNYKVFNSITLKLIDKGYRRISLMCGFNNYFSEHECILGFSDALDASGIPNKPGNIIETVISKEAAFRQAMYRIVQDPPEAILVSSELLTLGLMEAFDLCGVRVPEDCCVITLGEDCWNKSNYLPNILHTSRTAYLLGQRCIDTLVSNIKSPRFFEKEFMLFKDNVLDSGLDLPPVPKSPVMHETVRESLKILAPSLPTLLSMSAVGNEFEKKHNVHIEYDILSYKDLFNAIIDYADTGVSTHDIYVFDVSWLTFMGKKNAFIDISDFVRGDESLHSHIVRRNLDNCKYAGRYIGFPIVGGTHILFYRKDLFDMPLMQRQFESMHNAPLRPPRTWTEFNAIARLFTKSYNPYSPTIYGTSVMGSIHEELSLELLIRLWSFGGGLYDAHGHLALNSSQNVKGFESMLESCRYTEQDFLETSIDQSFHSFGAGNTAMLISFTEYASNISNFVQSDIVSKVDYAMIPGGTPVNVGWNFGISKNTEKKELIFEFYKWLARKSTSYYMTTLNGQSVITYPYDNYEIMKLYPWMSLTEKGQKASRNRTYPSGDGKNLIPPYAVENILYDIFRKMYDKEMSIEEALQFGQQELLKLSK